MNEPTTKQMVISMTIILIIGFILFPVMKIKELTCIKSIDGWCKCFNIVWKSEASFNGRPKGYRGMPFNKDIFSTQYTSDGYRYTLAKSTYCGREEPPVINAHTVIRYADRQKTIDFLVREYYIHNGRENEKKLPKKKALQTKTE